MKPLKNKKLHLLSAGIVAALLSPYGEAQLISGLSPFFLTAGCQPTSEVPPRIQVYPNAEVEPDLYIDTNPLAPSGPPLIVAAWQQDRYSKAGGADADYMTFSSDGGTTFLDPLNTLPLQNVQCFGGPYQRASDPMVVISPNGFVYFIGLGFNYSTVPNAVNVGRYKMNNSGGTFTLTPDTTVSLGAINGLKTTSTTDFAKMTRETLDPKGNTLYLTWDEFRQGSFFTGNPKVLSDAGKIFFTKTTDGGNTYDNPKPVFNVYMGISQALGAPNAQKFAPDIQTTGSRIEILNNPSSTAFSRLLDIMGTQTGLVNPKIPLKNFYEVIRSDNQGQNWTLASIINPDGLVGQAFVPESPLDNPQLIRSGDGVPSTATDRDRNLIYAAIQQHSLLTGPSFQGDGIPTEIDLYVSQDGGSSWTELKNGTMFKVNADVTMMASLTNPNPDITQAFNQAVAVLADHTIAVSYYDFRNHVQGDTSSLLTDRWLEHYRLDTTTTPPTLTKLNADSIRLTTRSFDMLEAPALTGAAISPPGLFLGDYQTMKAFGANTVYSVFGTTLDSSGAQLSCFLNSLLPDIHDDNCSNIMFTITTLP